MTDAASGDHQPPPTVRPPGARARAAVSAQNDKALAALQKMVRPQPKLTDEMPPAAHPAAEAAPGGSGSATGFVGMLARGGGGGDSGDSRAGVMTDKGALLAKYQLAMAREIPHAGGATAAPEKITRPLRRVSRWYRVAVPVAGIFTLLLLAIGGWAVGALFYMAKVSPAAPEEVHYPWVAWDFDVGYTQGSRVMAWSMLACIPVGLLLAVVAVVLYRRIRRSSLY